MLFLCSLLCGVMTRTPTPPMHASMMMCSVFHDPLERQVYQRRATKRHRRINRHLSAEFYKGKERKGKKERKYKMGIHRREAAGQITWEKKNL